MKKHQKSYKTIHIADHRFDGRIDDPSYSLAGQPLKDIEAACLPLADTLETVPYIDNESLVKQLQNGGLALIHGERLPQLILQLTDSIFKQPLTVVFFTTSERSFSFQNFPHAIHNDGNLVLLFQRNQQSWRNGMALNSVLTMTHPAALEIVSNTDRHFQIPELFLPDDTDPILEKKGAYLTALLNQRQFPADELQQIAWDLNLDLASLPQNIQNQDQLPEITKMLLGDHKLPTLEKAIKAIGASTKEKLVVFWNDDQYIAQAKPFIPGASAPKKGKKDSSLPATVITNHQQYLESAIYQSPGRSFSTATLIMLVELDWGNAPMSHGLGFRILQDLVRRGFKGGVLFFSIFPRAVLCETKLFPFAKIFPVYPIPSEPATWKEIEVPNFSEHKWELMRRYYLDKHGILDVFIHDLDNLTRPACATVDAVKAINKALTIQAASLNSSIMALIQEPKEDEEEGTRIAYVRRLIEAITEFKLAIKTADLQDPPPARDVIMMVEDDLDFAASMKQGLKDEFIDVDHYPDAASAILELQKNPKRHAALLLDMEMKELDEATGETDTKFWQPVQGIDVLEYASKLPWLAILGLSSLSRMAIGSSMAFDAIRVIPKATESDTKLPSYLSYKELAKDLYAMIDRKKELRLAGCPNTKLWIDKGLMAFYLALKSVGVLDALLDEVKDTVQMLLDGRLLGKPIPPMLSFSNLACDPKNLHTEKFLQKILAHRLVCLYFQKQDGYVKYQEVKVRIQGGDEADASAEVGRPTIVAHFNTFLGLNAKEGRRGMVISLEDLLDHENQWLSQATFDPKSALNILVNSLKNNLLLAKDLDPEADEIIPEHFFNINESVEAINFIWKTFEQAKADKVRRMDIQFELGEAKRANPQAYRSLEMIERDLDDVAQAFALWKKIEEAKA